MNKEKQDAMNKELISVVVPIFNAENYLVRCIESILCQDDSCFEIILVDDGSRDVSRKICTSYEKKYSHIHLISQNHAGVQYARKNGVENAKGKYITFVDADDEIEPAYVSFLRDLIDDSDCASTICCWIGMNGEEECRKGFLPEGKYDTPDRMEYFLKHAIVFCDDDWYQYGILPHMTGKLFRTDIAKDVLKEVSLNLRVGEDFDFVVRYLLRCKSVTISNKSFYTYYQRADSAVNASNPYYLRDIGEIFASLSKVFSEHPLRDDLQLQLQQYVLSRLAWIPFAVDWLPEKLPEPIFGCPYFQNIKGKNIILYGAGKIGQSLYQELIRQDQYKLVCWVDKNWEKMGNIMPEIVSPDKILETDYDAVVLAVGVTLKDEVKKELINMGVPKEKIIWKQLKRIR